MFNVKKTIALTVSVAHLLTTSTYGMYENIMPQKYRDDIERSDYYSPEKLTRRIDSQKTHIKQKNEIHRLAREYNRKLQDKIDKQHQENIAEINNSVAEFEQAVQKIRQKRYRIAGQKEGFNYLKYSDGKTVWLKDGLAYAIEKEKLIDALGNVSYRNTYNIEYNEKRLMTDYESETVDAKGHSTYVKWADAVYTDDSVHYADEDTKAAKKLVSFKEIVIDHNGNKTSRIRYNSEYNTQNLITAYTETLIDKYGNASKKVWSGALYDGNKQITGFVEEVTDWFGIKTKKIWCGAKYEYNTRYDKNDLYNRQPKYLLKEYHEEIIDSEGNTVSRDWFGAQYNEFGLLTSYQENRIDRFGCYTGKEFFNAVYDSFGRLIAYAEKIYDTFGYLSELVWQGASYDSFDNLICYREDKTDSNGNRSSYERFDVRYNKKGEMLEYSDKETDILGNSSRNYFLFQKYDNYGRNTAYVRETTDVLGNLTVNSFSGIVYDHKNNQLAFKQKIADSQKNITYVERGVSKYNALGLLTYYQDTKTDVFGNKTYETFSNASYDSYGRLASYTKDFIDQFGLKSKLVRSETRYNDHNQEIYYKGIKTSADGTKTESVFDNAAYNSKNQLVKYRMGYSKEGEIAVENHSDIVYDKFSRLYAFELAKKTERDALEVVYTLPEWIYIYDLSEEEISQLLDGEYVIKDEVELFAVSSENAYAEVLTLDVSRKHTAYDNSGRLSGYEESVLSYSENGEIESSGTVSYTCSYLSNNLLASSAESTIEMFADGSSKSEKKSWSSGGYDKKGLLTSYTETLTASAADAAGITVLDKTSYTERSRIEYNILGLMDSYTETGGDSSSDQVTTTKVSGIKYSDSLRMESYAYETLVQAGRSKNTVKGSRSGINYDKHGNIISYTDTSSNSQNNIAETVFCFGINYNIKNKQTVSQQITRRHGSDGSESLDILEYKAMADMSYNRLGLLASYSQAQSSSDKPGLISESTVQQSYDESGRVYNYTETGRSYSPDNAVDTAYMLEKTGIEYNNLGYAVFWNQSSKDDSASDVVKIAVVNAEYRDNGDMVFYSEKGLKRDVSGILRDEGYEIERTNFKYNKLGQAVKWRETNTNTSAAAQAQTSDFAVSYNTNGSQNSLHQKILYGSISGDYELDYIEVVNKTGMNYDNYGRIISFGQSFTSDAEPGVEKVSEISMSYDEKNNQTGYFERVERYLNGAKVEEYENNSTDYSYNDLGQIVSYVNTAHNTASPALTTENRIVMSYTDSWRASAIETGTLSYGEIDGLDYRVESTNIKNDIVYNDLGQMWKFEEIDHSSAAEDLYIVSDKIITYNSKNKESGAQETTREYNGGISEENLICVVETAKTGFDYDKNGLLTSYKSVSNDFRSPDLTEEKTISFSYDESLRHSAISENTHSFGTTADGKALNIHTTNNKEGIKYNDLGLVANYSLNSWNSQASSVWELSSVSLEYNSDGSQKVFNQEGRRVDEKNKLINEFSAVRSEFDYDDLGRTAGYTETSWNSDTPALETVTVFNQSFNSNGKAAYQKSETSSVNKDTREVISTSLYIKDDIQYDSSLGFAGSFIQTTGSSNSPGVTRETAVTGITYDSAGLEYSRKENGSETTVITSKDIADLLAAAKNISYDLDASELAKSSADELISLINSGDLVPGSNTVEFEEVHSNKTYDKYGNLTNYSKIKNPAENSPYGLEVEVVNVYTEGGMLLSTSENGQEFFYNSAEQKLSFEYSNTTAGITYDSFGMRSGWISTYKNSRQGQSITTTAVSAVEYDAFGNLVRMSEKTKVSGIYTAELLSEDIQMLEAELQKDGISEDLKLAFSKKLEHLRGIKAGDSFESETESLKENLLFDTCGRAVIVQNTEFAKENGDYTAVSAINVFRADGRIEKVCENITVKSTFVDSSGNMQESISNTKTTKSGFEYDGFGRATFFKQIDSQKQNGIEVLTEIDRTYLYDDYGRVIFSSEEKTTSADFTAANSQNIQEFIDAALANASASPQQIEAVNQLKENIAQKSGGNYILTETTEIDLFIYDSFGREVLSAQEADNSLMEGRSTKNIVVKNYNNSNKTNAVFTFSEQFKDGTSVKKTEQETLVTNFDYRGRVLRQKTITKEDNNIKEEKDNQDRRYDAYGNLVYSDSNITESASGDDGLQSKRQYSRRFEAFAEGSYIIPGLLAKYKSTTYNDITAPDKVTTQLLTQIYDDSGRVVAVNTDMLEEERGINSLTASDLNGDGSIFSKRTNTVRVNLEFNEDNLVTSYGDFDFDAIPELESAIDESAEFAANQSAAIKNDLALIKEEMRHSYDQSVKQYALKLRELLDIVIRVYNKDNYSYGSGEIYPNFFLKRDTRISDEEIFELIRQLKDVNVATDAGMEKFYLVFKNLIDNRYADTKCRATYYKSWLLAKDHDPIKQDMRNLQDTYKEFESTLNDTSNENNINALESNLREIWENHLKNEAELDKRVTAIAGSGFSSITTDIVYISDDKIVSQAVINKFDNTETAYSSQEYNSVGNLVYSKFERMNNSFDTTITESGESVYAYNISGQMISDFTRASPDDSNAYILITENTGFDSLGMANNTERFRMEQPSELEGFSAENTEENIIQLLVNALFKNVNVSLDGLMDSFDIPDKNEFIKSLILNSEELSYLSEIPDFTKRGSIFPSAKDNSNRLETDLRMIRRYVSEEQLEKIGKPAIQILADLYLMKNDMNMYKEALSWMQKNSSVAQKTGSLADLYAYYKSYEGWRLNKNEISNLINSKYEGFSDSGLLAAELMRINILQKAATSKEQILEPVKKIISSGVFKEAENSIQIFKSLAQSIYDYGRTNRVDVDDLLLSIQKITADMDIADETSSIIEGYRVLNSFAHSSAEVFCGFCENLLSENADSQLLNQALMLGYVNRGSELIRAGKTEDAVGYLEKASALNSRVSVFSLDADAPMVRDIGIILSVFEDVKGSQSGAELSVNNLALGSLPVFEKNKISYVYSVLNCLKQFKNTESVINTGVNVLSSATGIKQIVSFGSTAVKNEFANWYGFILGEDLSNEYFKSDIKDISTGIKGFESSYSRYSTLYSNIYTSFGLTLGPKITKENVTVQKRDAEGRAVSTVSNVKETGANLNHTYTLTTSNKNFGALGNVSEAVTIRSKDNQSPQKITETKSLNDVFGKNYYVKEIQSGGVYKVTETYNLRFDSKGRPVSAIQLMVKDSSAPSKRQIDIITTGYKGNNVSKSTIDTIEYGYSAAGTAKPDVLYKSYTTVVENYSYNSLGQVTSQSVIRSKDSAEPDAVRTTSKSNISYDATGRIYSYTQYSDGSSIYRYSTIYDSCGREHITEETLMVSNKETSVAGMSGTLKRGAVRSVNTYNYDPYGRLIYHKVDNTVTNYTNFPTVVKQIECTTEGYIYNALGQLLKSYSKGTETEHETEIFYKANGKIDETTSKNYDKTNGQGSISRERNIVYDSSGRKISSHNTSEHHITQGDARGQVYTSGTYKYIYDSAGNLIDTEKHGYKETKNLNYKGKHNFFNTDAAKIISTAVSVAVGIFTAGLGFWASAWIVAGYNAAYTGSQIGALGGSFSQAFRGAFISFAASMVGSYMGSLSGNASSAANQTLGQMLANSANYYTVVIVSSINLGVDYAAKKISQRSGNVSGNIWGVALKTFIQQRVAGLIRGKGVVSAKIRDSLDTKFSAAKFLSMAYKGVVAKYYKDMQDSGKKISSYQRGILEIGDSAAANLSIGGVLMNIRDKIANNEAKNFMQNTVKRDMDLRYGVVMPIDGPADKTIAGKHESKYSLPSAGVVVVDDKMEIKNAKIDDLRRLDSEVIEQSKDVIKKLENNEKIAKEDVPKVKAILAKALDIYADKAKENAKGNKTLNGAVDKIKKEASKIINKIESKLLKGKSVEKEVAKLKVEYKKLEILGILLVSFDVSVGKFDNSEIRIKVEDPKTLEAALKSLIKTLGKDEDLVMLKDLLKDIEFQLKLTNKFLQGKGVITEVVCKEGKMVGYMLEESGVSRYVPSTLETRKLEPGFFARIADTARKVYDRIKSFFTNFKFKLFGVEIKRKPSERDFMLQQEKLPLTPMPAYGFIQVSQVLDNSVVTAGGTEISLADERINRPGMLLEFTNDFELNGESFAKGFYVKDLDNRLVSADYLVDVIITGISDNTGKLAYLKGQLDKYSELIREDLNPALKGITGLDQTVKIDEISNHIRGGIDSILSDNSNLEILFNEALEEQNYLAMLYGREVISKELSPKIYRLDSALSEEINRLSLFKDNYIGYFLTATPFRPEWLESTRRSDLSVEPKSFKHYTAQKEALSSELKKAADALIAVKGSGLISGEQYNALKENLISNAMAVFNMTGKDIFELSGDIEGYKEHLKQEKPIKYVFFSALNKPSDMLDAVVSVPFKIVDPLAKKHPGLALAIGRAGYWGSVVGLTGAGLAGMLLSPIKSMISLVAGVGTTYGLERMSDGLMNRRQAEFWGLMAGIGTFRVVSNLKPVVALDQKASIVSWAPKLRSAAVTAVKSIINTEKLPLGKRAPPEGVLSNPIPENGIFARAMPSKNTNEFLIGNKKFSGQNETFISAAEDLSGVRTNLEVAQKLTLLKYKNEPILRENVDSVVLFKFKNLNNSNLSSPIEIKGGRGYGYFGKGQTKGGAREWVMKNGYRKDLDIDIIGVFKPNEIGGVRWNAAMQGRKLLTPNMLGVSAPHMQRSRISSELLKKLTTQENTSISAKSAVNIGGKSILPQGMAKALGSVKSQSPSLKPNSPTSSLIKSAKGASYLALMLTSLSEANNVPTPSSNPLFKRTPEVRIKEPLLTPVPAMGYISKTANTLDPAVFEGLKPGSIVTNPANNINFVFDGFDLKDMPILSLMPDQTVNISIDGRSFPIRVGADGSIQNYKTFNLAHGISQGVMNNVEVCGVNWDGFVIKGLVKASRENPFVVEMPYGADDSTGVADEPLSLFRADILPGTTKNAVVRQDGNNWIFEKGDIALAVPVLFGERSTGIIADVSLQLGEKSDISFVGATDLSVIGLDVVMVAGGILVNNAQTGVKLGSLFRVNEKDHIYITRSGEEFSARMINDKEFSVVFDKKALRDSSGILHVEDAVFNGIIDKDNNARLLPTQKGSELSLKANLKGNGTHAVGIVKAYIDKNEYLHTTGDLAGRFHIPIKMRSDELPVESRPVPEGKTYKIGEYTSQFRLLYTSGESDYAYAHGRIRLADDHLLTFGDNCAFSIENNKIIVDLYGMRYSQGTALPKDYFVVRSGGVLPPNGAESFDGATVTKWARKLDGGELYSYPAANIFIDVSGSLLVKDEHGKLLPSDVSVSGKHVTISFETLDAWFQEVLLRDYELESFKKLGFDAGSSALKKRVVRESFDIPVSIPAFFIEKALHKVGFKKVFISPELKMSRTFTRGMANIAEGTAKMVGGSAVRLASGFFYMQEYAQKKLDDFLGADSSISRQAAKLDVLERIFHSSDSVLEDGKYLIGKAGSSAVNMYTHNAGERLITHISGKLLPSLAGFFSGTALASKSIAEYRDIIKGGNIFEQSLRAVGNTFQEMTSDVMVSGGMLLREGYISAKEGRLLTGITDMALGGIILAGSAAGIKYIFESGTVYMLPKSVRLNLARDGVSGNVYAQKVKFGPLELKIRYTLTSTKLSMIKRLSAKELGINSRYFGASNNIKITKSSLQKSLRKTGVKLTAAELDKMLKISSGKTYVKLLAEHKGQLSPAMLKALRRIINKNADPALVQFNTFKKTMMKDLRASGLRSTDTLLDKAALRMYNYASRNPAMSAQVYIKLRLELTLKAQPTFLARFKGIFGGKSQKAYKEFYRKALNQLKKSADFNDYVNSIGRLAVKEGLSLRKVSRTMFGTDDAFAMMNNYVGLRAVISGDELVVSAQNMKIGADGRAYIELKLNIQSTSGQAEQIVLNLSEAFIKTGKGNVRGDFLKHFELIDQTSRGIKQMDKNTAQVYNYIDNLRGQLVRYKNKLEQNSRTAGKPGGADTLKVPSKTLQTADDGYSFVAQMDKAFDKIAMDLYEVGLKPGVLEQSKLSNIEIHKIFRQRIGGSVKGLDKNVGDAVRLLQKDFQGVSEIEIIKLLDKKIVDLRAKAGADIYQYRTIKLTDLNNSAVTLAKFMNTDALDKVRSVINRQPAQITSDVIIANQKAFKSILSPVVSAKEQLLLNIREAVTVKNLDNSIVFQGRTAGYVNPTVADWVPYNSLGIAIMRQRFSTPSLFGSMLLMKDWTVQTSLDYISVDTDNIINPRNRDK